MFAELQRMIKDCLTGIDGKTYDPARVVGYGASALGVATFLFNSVSSVIHTHTFDAQGFGIGFGALMGGISAVGAGVRWKSGTEPTDKTNPKG